MDDAYYAMTQRHRVFTGFNAESVLEDVLIGWPNATITASTDYPGETAMLEITTDIPNNGGYPAQFHVGDSWHAVSGTLYTVAMKADTTYMVPLADFVRDVAPQAAMAVGYGTTPSLAVGASATVTVPMVPDLPEEGHNVAIGLAGSAQLLGALQITGHTVVSASAVDVSVRNSFGSQALGGATVLVTALRNG
jgi:hypothetical protein